MILGSANDQEVAYWYEGVCPYSGEIVRLPRTLQAEAIAESLMQELLMQGALIQEQIHEGKMYGILLVELPTGEQAFLKAFSGLLNGKSQIAGWVPPIAGREKIALEESITLAKLAAIKQKLIELSQIPERSQYEKRSLEYESQLEILRANHQISKQQRQIKRSQLTSLLEKKSAAEIAISLQDVELHDLERESQLEKMARRDFKRERDQVLQPIKQAIADADALMQVLKQQRRELSRTLQTQMHHAYVLTNFAGESRSLRQLITEGAMPTGMGDCCAPKLLDYAANHDLKPLAMAEFWWGSPSPDGYKIQGKFYEACVERCQPLMGFLLSGRRSTPASHATAHVVASSALQNLQIIYEDEFLIAIAKPAGLLSVPGRYLDTQDSVLSRLRLSPLRQELGDQQTLYPVHRLDRQTSGILLFARDLESLRHLHQQFQQRQIHKVYEALLSGICKRDRGTIDLPLWGNPENRPYQQVDFQRGKPSVTQFQVLRLEGDYSRIEFIPLTGRTHQLRVHAADIRGLGITILGDRLYGCHAETSRLHLHARELTFIHPRSQKLMHLQIPVSF
jgi:tRNA pseudouridine32 synthase/23S rRNA pseudouridine746 synthase